MGISMCWDMTPLGSGVGISEIELCSLLIVLACTKFLEIPETHREIFVDDLGGVDTPVG